MSEKIKGITLEIGGDLSGLKKAIGGVNSDLKSMQSELRGIESLLKLDPSNVELLEQKQELLNRSVDETEKKLKALKQVKERADADMAAGTEINEKEYRNLVRELVSTENKFKDLQKEAKNFGSVAKQQAIAAGDAVSDFGKKLEDAGKNFSGVSAAGAAVVTGVGALAIKAGAAADDINTLAKVTGLATDELQRMQYGSALVDVEVETVAKSLAKLKNNMQSARDGSKTTAAAFESLGVNVANADGSLRDSNEVFYETIDALGQIQNETERDAIAMDIFGRSAAELNPLIEEGSDAFRKAAENASIMTQEQLDAANKFNDVIDTTKATVESSLMTLGGVMAEQLQPVIEKLAGWVTSLAEKLRNMNPTLLTVIAVIAGIVAAIAPLLIVIGKVATGIGAIIRIIPALKTGIAAINTVLRANPIGIVITLVAALIGYLVHLYKTSEDFRNKVNAVWEKVKAGFSALADWFSAKVEAVKQVITGLIDKFKSIIDAVTEIKNTIVNKLSEFFSLGVDLVKNIWAGILSVKDWILEKISGWVDSILGGIKEFFGISSPSKETYKDGQYLVEGIANGIDDNAYLATNAMKNLTSDVLGTVGNNLDVDLAVNSGSLADAITTLNDNATIAVDSAQQSKSELLNEIASATAQYVGQALLDGLVGVQDTILSAMPSKLVLNINGRQVANTTWLDFETLAELRSRLFAPSRQQIASIAASVVNASKNPAT